MPLGGFSGPKNGAMLARPLPSRIRRHGSRGKDGGAAPSPPRASSSRNVFTSGSRNPSSHLSLERTVLPPTVRGPSSKSHAASAFSGSDTSSFPPSTSA